MTQRLTVIRGDAATLVIATRLPVDDDLSDATEITFTVGDPLVVKTFGEDQVEVTAVDEVEVTLDTDDTRSAPGVRTSYPWDLQVEFGDGRVVTAARGLFIVLPDVTT